MSTARSNLNTSVEDAKREQMVRSILMTLGICGAALQRDSIQFARAVADVLLWSAEHATGLTRQDIERVPSLEWRCDACHEMVPGNFDLCWNCRIDRSDVADGKKEINCVEPHLEQVACGDSPLLIRGCR